MRLRGPVFARWESPVNFALCVLLGLAGCEEDQGPGPEGDQTPPEARECDQDKAPDPEWLELEDEVLRRVNQVRAKGASCGSRGTFGPAPALKLDVRLRCAARRHSQDMAERGYFDHESPEGQDPLDRIRKTGYTGRLVGENIAAGQSSAGVVMSSWLKSDGHCANIMKEEYTELGVGYVQTPKTEYRHYWTQNFGSSK